MDNILLVKVLEDLCVCPAIAQSFQLVADTHLNICSSRPYLSLNEVNN